MPSPMSEALGFDRFNAFRVSTSETIARVCFIYLVFIFIFLERGNT